VTAAAVGDDLHGGSAERIREAARLRLHIGTRRHAGSQRGKHKRVTPNVRQIGNLLRAHGRSQICRSSIEQFHVGRYHDLLPHRSDLQCEIDPLIAAGRQHKAGPRLRAETGDLDRHLVGIRRQERDRVSARTVRLCPGREMGRNVGRRHVRVRDLRSGSIRYLSCQGSQILLSPEWKRTHKAEEEEQRSRRDDFVE